MQLERTLTWVYHTYILTKKFSLSFPWFCGFFEVKRFVEILLLSAVDTVIAEIMLPKVFYGKGGWVFQNYRLSLLSKNFVYASKSFCKLMRRKCMFQELYKKSLVKVFYESHRVKTIPSPVQITITVWNTWRNFKYLTQFEIHEAKFCHAFR